MRWDGPRARASCYTPAMKPMFHPDDLAAMEKVRDAFPGSEHFNPCKIFPGRAGCGEGWRLPRLPALGPDVYI